MHQFNVQVINLFQYTNIILIITSVGFEKEHQSLVEGCQQEMFPIRERSFSKASLTLIPFSLMLF